jgi:toxin FitB
LCATQIVSKRKPAFNVVDSCGWLAYWAGEETADFFAPALLDTPRLIVPAVTVFEVCKRVLITRGAEAAEFALRAMQQAKIVQLDAEQMLAAAATSAQYKLAMADAWVWQTAQIHGAQVYTQDAGLKGLPGVSYVEKRLAKR